MNHQRFGEEVEGIEPPTAGSSPHAEGHKKDEPTSMLGSFLLESVRANR